jgi:hypothetical protein
VLHYPPLFLRPAAPLQLPRSLSRWNTSFTVVQLSLYPFRPLSSSLHSLIFLSQRFYLSVVSSLLFKYPSNDALGFPRNQVLFAITIIIIIIITIQYWLIRPSHLLQFIINFCTYEYYRVLAGLLGWGIGSLQDLSTGTG